MSICFEEKHLTDFHLNANLIILHHIGVAVADAAMISALFTLAEFKEFFVELATKIMIRDEYIKELDKDKRKQLRLKIAKTMVSGDIDNERFKHSALLEQVDDLLFKNWLPGTGSNAPGFIREDYSDKICITYMTLGEAIKESYFPDTPPVEIWEKINKDIKVYKFVTYCSYKVIHSKKNTLEKYTHRLKYEVAPIDTCDQISFPLDKRVKHSVSKNNFSYTPCKQVVKDEEIIGDVIPCESNSEEGYFSYDENGECEIWSKCIEYKPITRDKSLTTYMRYLTYNSSVTVTQEMHSSIDENANLDFFAFVVAPEMIKDNNKTLVKKDVDEKGLNKIFISCNDWLLEGNAFSVDWWEAPANRRI